MDFVGRLLTDIVKITIDLIGDFTRPIIVPIIGIIGLIIALNNFQSDLNLMTFILGLPLPPILILGVLLFLFREKI